MQKTLEILNKKRFDALAAYNAEVSAAEEKLKKTVSGLDKFLELLPRLIAALASVHLVIDSEDPISTSPDSVHFTAKPTDKFKFIKFQGYTARGEGRNRTALYAKAEKLGKAIGSKIDCSVGINQYSLEVKDGEQGKFVLIDVFYKK